MQKNKEKYIKPQVTKIKLDAKTAVLASCKIPHGSGGPGNINCRGFGGPTCVEHGS